MAAGVFVSSSHNHHASRERLNLCQVPLVRRSRRRGLTPMNVQVGFRGLGVYGLASGVWGFGSIFLVVSVVRGR